MLSHLDSGTVHCKKQKKFRRIRHLVAPAQKWKSLHPKEKLQFPHDHARNREDSEVSSHKNTFWTKNLGSIAAEMLCVHINFRLITVGYGTTCTRIMNLQLQPGSQILPCDHFCVFPPSKSVWQSVKVIDHTISKDQYLTFQGVEIYLFMGFKLNAPASSWLFSKYNCVTDTSIKIDLIFPASFNAWHSACNGCI